MRILFGCILFNGAYNAFSSILRALGDSRTPLIAMLIASVSNILLDLLFVLGFHWGRHGGGRGYGHVPADFGPHLPAGDAAHAPIAHEPEERRWDGKLAMSLVKLGGAHGAAKPDYRRGRAVCAVGGQPKRGCCSWPDIAATNKLYGLLELAAVSFGFAMSTFAGQNLGAGHIRRIRQGMRTAACLGIGVAVVIAAAMLLFGRAIVACFVSGDTNQVEQVVSIGTNICASVLGFAGALPLAPVPFGLAGHGEYRGRHGVGLF